MGPLKNPRYEKFAQMVASGLTGSEAYRQVAGATAGKNADVLAARWMDSPGVRERIAELREANSRKATLSREQTIEFLCNVINTSAAKVDADSPLVQSAEFADGKPVKLRIPDKIAAVKELVRMCGWAKPDRVELSATDTLAEFVNSIRKSGRPQENGNGGLPHAEDNREGPPSKEPENAASTAKSKAARCANIMRRQGDGAFCAIGRRLICRPRGGRPVHSCATPQFGFRKQFVFRGRAVPHRL